MKIAFTGTSGSGKTTLVKWVSKEFKLQHISGSAGDMSTQADKEYFKNKFGYFGEGHLDVIKFSAISPFFAFENQERNRWNRNKLIQENDNFVTDRSPLDNLVYCIAQAGFHKEISDNMIENFAYNCLLTWGELTHVIYVKAVQPHGIEDNGSRISNKWYQQASDAQFEYWLKNWFVLKQIGGPKLLILRVWDLDTRKDVISNFLNY